MRRLVACLLLGLALAACGEEEEPAGTSSPDAPVSSADEPAASPAPAATPASGAACRRLAPRLVGEALAAAEAHATERGCSVRVALQDGRSLRLTEDYSPARINVRVEDGTITGVEFLG